MIYSNSWHPFCRLDGCRRLNRNEVEGQAMILGDEGWPIATAKGMQVGKKTPGLGWVA